MICRKCGSSIPTGRKYCSKCGAPAVEPMETYPAFMHDDSVENVCRETPEYIYNEPSGSSDGSAVRRAYYRGGIMEVENSSENREADLDELDTIITGQVDSEPCDFPENNDGDLDSFLDIDKEVQFQLNDDWFSDLPDIESLENDLPAIEPLENDFPNQDEENEAGEPEPITDESREECAVPEEAHQRDSIIDNEREVAVMKEKPVDDFKMIRIVLILLAIVVLLAVVIAGLSIINWGNTKTGGASPAAGSGREVSGDSQTEPAPESGTSSAGLTTPAAYDTPAATGLSPVSSAASVQTGPPYELQIGTAILYSNAGNYINEAGKKVYYTINFSVPAVVKAGPNTETLKQEMKDALNQYYYQFLNFSKNDFSIMQTRGLTGWDVSYQVHQYGNQYAVVLAETQKYPGKYGKEARNVFYYDGNTDKFVTAEQYLANCGILPEAVISVYNNSGFVTSGEIPAVSTIGDVDFYVNSGGSPVTLFDTTVYY